MNVERIETIIAWLENGAVHIDEDGTRIGFDMDYWFGELGESEKEESLSGCGTAMCIGGAAEQFFGTEVPGTDSTSETAADLLGLPLDLADKLFYPWGKAWYEKAGRQDLTPEYMAGVLRRLIETGELVG